MIEGARTLNARTSMKTDYELEFVFNIIDLSTFCKKVFHMKSAVFCVVLFCIPGLSLGYYSVYTDTVL